MMYMHGNCILFLLAMVGVPFKKKVQAIIDNVEHIDHHDINHPALFLFVHLTRKAYLYQKHHCLCCRSLEPGAAARAAESLKLCANVYVNWCNYVILCFP